MTTDGEKILRLIESVSLSNPADDETLDLIDARVHAYCSSRTFVANGKTCTDDHTSYWVQYRENPPCKEYGVPRYTRSRDALKAIRPKGWEKRSGWRTAILQETQVGDCWLAKLYKIDGKAIMSFACPTEELAELHAIIQALIEERRRA